MFSFMSQEILKWRLLKLGGSSANYAEFEVKLWVPQRTLMSLSFEGLPDVVHPNAIGQESIRKASVIGYKVSGQWLCQRWWVFPMRKVEGLLWAVWCLLSRGRMGCAEISARALRGYWKSSCTWNLCPMIGHYLNIWTKGLSWRGHRCPQIF